MIIEATILALSMIFSSIILSCAIKKISIQYTINNNSSNSGNLSDSGTDDKFQLDFDDESLIEIHKSRIMNIPVSEAMISVSDKKVDGKSEDMAQILRQQQMK